MYFKSAGKYMFLFPVQSLKEVKAQRLKFPYSLLPLGLYVMLFAYFSLFASIEEIAVVVISANVYLLFENVFLRAALMVGLTIIGAFVGMEYLVSVAYGAIGAFVFGSEVYIDDEWNVYLRN